MCVVSQQAGVQQRRNHTYVRAGVYLLRSATLIIAAPHLFEEVIDMHVPALRKEGRPAERALIATPVITGQRKSVLARCNASSSDGQPTAHAPACCILHGTLLEASATTAVIVLK